MPGTGNSIYRKLNVGSSLTSLWSIFCLFIISALRARLGLFGVSCLIPLGLSAGTGAPSWRPQKNRSRAASGGAALASPGPGSGSGPPAGSGGKERSENLSLRRSVSELSLQGRRRRQQERRQQALSMAPGAADTQIGPADPGDFDQLTQCLIQAPSNRPYFLLLQGYQDAQVRQPLLPRRELCSGLLSTFLRLQGDKITTPRIPWVAVVSGLREGVGPAR